MQLGRYRAAVPLWTDYFSGREADEQLARALAELHFRAAAEVLKANATGLTEVEEHITEANRLAPDDHRFVFFLALLRMLDGDFEKARVSLQEGLARERQDSRLRYYLALCAKENGDFEGAESALKAVIA